MPTPNDFIDAKLKELADTPPGPQAQNLAQQLAELLKALLANDNIKQLIPATWMGWILAAIALLSIVGGSAFVGRLSAPTQPPAIVNNHPPDVVIVDPSKAEKRYYYYVLAGTKLDKSLPTGVIETCADGSTYGPDRVPLPVQVVKMIGVPDEVRKLP